MAKNPVFPVKRYYGGVMKKALYGIFIFLYIMFSISLVACGDSNTDGEPSDPVTPVKYTVTVVNGTGGGEYDENTTVTVTATVPEGKVFVKWTVSDREVSTANPYTFTVTEDVTITAVSESDVPVTETCAITRINVISGETVPMGTKTYDKGEEITLIADEISKKEFVAWRFDDADGEILSEQATYSFVVEKDVTIVAVYRGKPVTPVTDGGGFQGTDG